MRNVEKRKKKEGIIEMAYPKKDKHVVGVGGSVLPETREKIYKEAFKKQISPSKLIGNVLEDFVGRLEDVTKEVDPNQLELFPTTVTEMEHAARVAAKIEHKAKRRLVGRAKQLAGHKANA